MDEREQVEAPPYLRIHFPGYATIFQNLLTPYRDFMFDSLHDIFAGLDGFGAVDGGGEDKQTDLACQDSAETVVDMETGQRIGFEGSLPDFMELEVGHFGVSGVFDGSDWFAIDHVISNLAEEDAVGTDILFGAMGSNRFGDEVRRDRAVDEDFLWFLFCHYRIKSTDTSHADAYADEGLDHGIFKFNFIQREMMVQATI